MNFNAVSKTLILVQGDKNYVGVSHAWKSHAQIGRSNSTPRILTLKYTQFLWGILSLIILSNGSIAQQAAAEDEEEYSEDEYEEYEEYDYGGCSKLS